MDILLMVNGKDLLADPSWLWWVVIGGLAGLIANVIRPRPGRGGLILGILLGIGGALLVGFLGQQLGWYDSGEGAGFLAAIVGAVLILMVYRMVARR